MNCLHVGCHEWSQLRTSASQVVLLEDDPRKDRFGQDRPAGAATRRAASNQGWLVSQDARHLQDPLESYDRAIVNLNFLILDPCTFDILQRLVGAFDALKDCVFKALLADTADFADACNGHDQSFTVGRQADMISGEEEVEVLVLCLILQGNSSEPG